MDTCNVGPRANVPGAPLLRSIADHGRHGVHVPNLELSLGEDTVERAFVFPKKAVNIDMKARTRGVEGERLEIEYRHDGVTKNQSS